MNSLGKEEILMCSGGIIIVIVTFVSVFLRKSAHNLNGNMIYIAVGALPLCFFSNIIMSLVQGSRIKHTKDNKPLKVARIISTAFFGIVPLIILVYLIYYYFSTDCNVYQSLD
jgi:hypothetical protein